MSVALVSSSASKEISLSAIIVIQLVCRNRRQVVFGTVAHPTLVGSVKRRGKIMLPQLVPVSLSVARHFSGICPGCR